MKAKKTLWAGLVIVLSCILIYFPILGHEFLTKWDDGWQVFNPNTEQWSWDIFTGFLGGQYSPVNQLFYTIIHHFVGYNPTFFHFFSLLLHTANALLIFFIVRRILSRFASGQKAYFVALTVAFLFSVHPLQIEAVAWISASKILTYTLFYLWAVWFYLRYLTRSKPLDFILMLVLFTLSFGGKEQALTFIVTLFWIDLVYKRNFKSSILWYEKVPVLVLTILFVMVTLFSYGTDRSVMSSSYPFIYRIAFACYSVVEYLIKTILPTNLLYIYPYPMSFGEPLPLQFWIYPIAILVALVCFWKIWTKRPVLLGLLWFFIHMGMMLHIIPLSRVTITADRYVYLAVPGLFFIAAWYLYDAWKNKQKFYKIWIGIFSVWVVFLCFSSFQRVKVWENNDTLKKEVRELLEKKKLPEDMQNIFEDGTQY